MLDTRGEARPCTLARDSLWEENGDRDLRQAWSGAKISQLRAEFRSGKLPRQCAACAEKTAAGYESRRERMNANLKRWGRASDSDWEAQKRRWLDDGTKELKMLDIAFDRVCNLSCSMCSPEYSTSWARALGESSPSPREMPRELFEEVLASAAGLERIWVKGGEPFASPRALEFLERLPKTGFCGEVYIATNATLIGERAMAALRGLPSLGLSISVDGVGQVYDWIRGEKFARVEEGIARALSLSNIGSLRIAFTASAHNLWNLPDFMEWDLRQRTLDPRYGGAHFLQYAAEEKLRCENLPLADRREIRALSEKYAGAYAEKDLQNLWNVLARPDASAESQVKFHQWTRQMNQLRGRDLYQILPRLPRP